jgi:membrane protease YdiL (CAAX protease family)
MDPQTDIAGPGKVVPDKFELATRVGVFVVLGWLTLILSPYLMVLVVGSRDLNFVVGALASFAAAAVANAAAVRIFEQGRLSDLGLGWNPGWSAGFAGESSGSSGRELMTGAGVGIGAAMLLLAGPLAAGAASLAPSAAVDRPWISLPFVSVVLLFGAAGEEMLFHGYAFQLLARTLGPFATILPVGLLFGLAHMGNPNATFLGVLNTIGWGVLLGYAYVRTGALWLPIGMHFGWNLALALSGANLSGFTMGLTGYALRWRTGDLWSGGGYGPEGSLLTTVVVAALFFVVVRVTPERDLLSEV